MLTFQVRRMRNTSLLVLSLVLICSVYSFSLQQQQPQLQLRPQKSHQSKSLLIESHGNSKVDVATNIVTTVDSKQPLSNIKRIVKPDEIIWKVRPCENPTRIQMLHWYVCGIMDEIIIILMDRLWKRNTPQPTQRRHFFPSHATRRRFSFLFNIGQSGKETNEYNNSQQMVVLLATITIPNHRTNTGRITGHRPQEEVIGRFGIVTEPGPVVPPPLDEAIQRIYDPKNRNRHNSTSSVIQYPNGCTNDDKLVGAIIYMYVEPDYRGIQNNIGGQALNVIHTIQRSCHCTYTILVANDKTLRDSTTSHSNKNNNIDTGYNNNDMKLVQWYQRNGYHIAEEIQDMLGSPNGIYGITMITSLYDHPHDDDREPQEMMMMEPTIPVIQWW